MTFLFTDVEGSTALWEGHPVEMRSALERHDRILRGVIEGQGGYVFSTAGDAFCASFGRAGDALAAAVEAQEALGGEVWPEATPMRVRMGLHTGEVQERDGDYFGPPVNLAARVMSVGHGGQVLVSAVTAGLVGDAGLVDLGEHRLKGVARPVRIFQAGTGRFAALGSETGTVRLPAMLSSLVGRDVLAGEVVDRLGSARLVTLVGVGGVGKTRLAIAAAEQAAVSRDLTVFVDLGAVSDGAEVLAAVARALEVTSPVVAAVTLALADRRSVLVMDNCEHVLDAAADLIAELLQTVPTLTVLATSREGLGVDGEQLVAVPGLETRGESASAVTLFAVRAGQVDPGFELDRASREAVAVLCAGLDGIPLAIELAAARVGSMSPAQLVQRLDQRFELLTGGRRRRSRDRQRTLRETIDWSFELLDGDEQDLFERLAVFAASFDLDAARAVAADRSEIAVLDLLAALVDKSLLTVAHTGGMTRYRYLETIRSYADERLEQRADHARVMGALQQHLASRVARVVDELFSTAIDARKLQIEIPNLRRCFDDAIAHSDIAAAASLITPFAQLGLCIPWDINGWADELLALHGVAGHDCEVALLTLRIVDRQLNAEFRDLKAACERLITRATRHGDQSVPWWAWRSYVQYSLTAGDYAAVETRIGPARESAQHIDADRSLHTRLVLTLFWTLATSPSPEVALAEFGDDLADGRVHPSRLVRQFAFFASAVLAQRQGRYDTMLEHATRATEVGIEGAEFWFAALQLRAWANLSLGNIDEAVRLADEDLELAYRYGSQAALVLPTVIYSAALQARNEAEAAATIRGWLPPKMTVFLIDELHDLDNWLASRLSDDDRQTLAADGRTLGPRDFQELTHTLLAKP